MKTPSMTPNAIRKRNQAFNKLTKPQQRVAIAKDVLLQLKSKNIKATSGRYVWSEKLSKKLASPDGEAQFCEFLPKAGTYDVCAKGAIFLSLVLKNDDLKVHELTTSSYDDNRRYIDDTAIEDYVATGLKVFSKSQLDLIEAYFEYESCTESFSDLNDRKRLEEIMQNIVANNGVFRPTQIDKKFPDVEEKF